MMKFRRKFAPVAMLAAFAMVLAACGDADDDTDAGDEPGDEEAADGESWELVESSTAAMLAELGAAIENEEPVVVTLWHPHWAYDRWDLKDLEDPEGALGEAEEIHSVARPGFTDDHPDVAEWIGNFEMSVEEVAELSTLVLGVEDDELDSPHDDELEAARAWVEDNEDTVEGWIGDDYGSDVGGGDEISFGYIAWDEAIAVTNLWNAILTDHGFEVSQEQADVAPTFDGVATGEWDLFLDMWLPATHEDYQEQYGEDLEQLGVWFDDAALTWVVPEYMDDVNSIEDLAEHRDEFGGQIIGIEPGAGLTRISVEEVMPAYGLD
jgi:glycine betaine/proline transport system substrate-binding protein